VILKCCGAFACDECARSGMLKTNPSQCPLCKSPATPDDLLPNLRIRQAVAKWRADQARKRIGDVAAVPATSLVISGPVDSPSNADGVFRMRDFVEVTFMRAFMYKLLPPVTTVMHASIHACSPMYPSARPVRCSCGVLLADGWRLVQVDLLPTKVTVVLQRVL
jgi:hypothetical protein